MIGNYFSMYRFFLHKLVELSETVDEFTHKFCSLFIQKVTGNISGSEEHGWYTFIGKKLESEFTGLVWILINRFSFVSPISYQKSRKL